MSTHLVWFRNDLRTIDHTALHHACQSPNAQVLAIFIATPEQWQQHHMSPRQAWFIQQHLKQLKEKLDALNIPLLYREVSDFAAQKTQILAICQQYAVTDVFYHKQYEWNEQQRDNQLEQQLHAAQIQSHRFDDAVLFAPGRVLNGQGNMYKVYTPFRQKCIQHLYDAELRIYPKPDKRRVASSVKSESIQPFSYPCQATPEFQIGEEAALERLRQFCQEQVADYHQNRNFPSAEGTSRLSAYLAIGAISPRQCLAALRFEYPDMLERVTSGAFSWFNELIWREFYRHLLVAFPRVSKNKAFTTWTDHIYWHDDPASLERWQKGLTGFPIVDAAMRQLNQTGWMHNRLRMIVGSFLVKDLLIDWRQGERYFMSQLIDGDFAANNGGWQWAASAGADAAPYFRIFNPTTQGQRFDANGQFIRQYLPELAQVPRQFIHKPHEWAVQNGVLLDYPEPMIDHAQARLRTLSEFDRAKSMKNVALDE